MNRKEYQAYNALKDTARAVPPANVDRAVLAAARLAVLRYRRRKQLLAAATVATVIAVVWLALFTAGAPVSLFAFPTN